MSSDAPEVKKGAFSPVIKDSHGVTIGFIKKGAVYKSPLGEPSLLFGYIGEKEGGVRGLTLDSGETVGCIDCHGNVLNAEGKFVGSIVRRSGFSPLLLFLLVMTFITVYFACYFIGIYTPYATTPLVIKIEDTNGKAWTGEERLNIFDGVDRVIYPGSKGTYTFIIENGGEEVEYSVELSDVNESRISMVYRLRMNNVYIMSDGSKKGIEDMKFYNLILKSGSSVVYTLEWEWDADGNNEQDTYIGDTSSGSAEYTLNIRIVAEPQKTA